MNQPSNPFPALFMLAGFAVLVTGVWVINRPAGLIVIGLGLLIFGFAGRRPGAGGDAAGGK